VSFLEKKWVAAPASLGRATKSLLGQQKREKLGANTSLGDSFGENVVNVEVGLREEFGKGQGK